MLGNGICLKLQPVYCREKLKCEAGTGAECACALPHAQNHTVFGGAATRCNDAVQCLQAAAQVGLKLSTPYSPRTGRPPPKQTPTTHAAMNLLCFPILSRMKFPASSYTCGDLRSSGLRAL